MRVELEHERAVVLIGDSAGLGDFLAESTVDAIVTDPPAAVKFMGRKWDGDRGGRDQWSAWFAETMSPAYRALKPGGYALVWALPRTSHWTARGLELAGFETRDLVHDIAPIDDAVAGFLDSLDDAQQDALTRLVESQASPIFYHLFGQGMPKGLTANSAAITEGSGTGLKPAVEHWILARKKLDGTVEANQAKWGTGVINIAASRNDRGNWPAHLALQHAPGCTVKGVFVDRKATFANVSEAREHDGSTNFAMGKQATTGAIDMERAAYACVAGCPVGALDAQSGISKPQKARDAQTPQGGDSPVRFMRGTKIKHQFSPKDNGGGASRFFYVAKPSRREKDVGLTHLATSTGGAATGRAEGSAGTRNPRAGAGRTGGARNIHPTVKSVELMTWLINLITPPGGTVLDPFAGSGTTGVAAIAAGYSFIGADAGGDKGEYVPVLLGRIQHALKGETP